MENRIAVYTRPNGYDIFKIKIFTQTSPIKLTPHHLQAKFHNTRGV